MLIMSVVYVIHSLYTLYIEIGWQKYEISPFRANYLPPNLLPVGGKYFAFLHIRATTY